VLETLTQDEALIRTGQLAKADEEFSEALELDPNFAPAYLNTGDNCLALDELAR